MAQAETAPVKYAGRNYLVECAAVMALYVVAVWAQPWLVAHAANHGLAVVAMLLPAVPVWLVLGVVWRYYRRIDEYEQKTLLETLALSFGIGACAIVTYAFAMDAGLPKIAFGWAWPVLAVCWGLVTAFRRMVSR